MSAGLGGVFGIAASGMAATRVQMDVVAENLANADSTSGPDGKPYQRKEVVLQEVGGGGFGAALAGAMGVGAQSASVGGVQVAGIVADTSPGKQVYDPGNPDANAQGYVTMPNVEPVTEMVDLISSSRSYEADVTAMQTAKQMFTKTLDLLR